MTTVGDFLIERLHAWGVRRIFGYPGDGINGIIAAIHRREDDIDFVQTRHEEMAASYATAHAKFTGELGVCLATSGPGAIHLLNGLYDAKADHVPVLAIVGQSATTAIGSEYQQEVDLGVLFKDVASDYLTTVTHPAAMRHAVDRAIRIALATRSVTALIVPLDVQTERAVPVPPHAHNTAHSSIGYQAPRTLPRDADLQRAAAVLNAGSKVALLVGAGASGAQAELIALADVLQAGCAKALLGKAVLPDDLPWVTGTVGLLGTHGSDRMMQTCDTLLLIGTNFPYGEFLPKEGKVRAVQIDITGHRLGLRYPTEVNLTGDAAETIRALVPWLDAKPDTGWRAELAEHKAQAERIDATRNDITGDPVNPESTFVALSPRLPDHAIVTADAGTSTNFAARHLKMREGMKFSLSGGLASMGSAVPYAIAAKFAYPDRVAIALTGDGAMQMNGINELITVAHYWQRWSDPRLIIMVSNNRDLNQVTWEMRIETGVPKFPGSQDLPDFPYARYAEMLGFVGVRVEHARDLGAAWERVLAADRPAVIEVLTDPNISLLPPHITVEQGKEYSKALLRGDPEEANIIVQSVKQVVAGVLPGHQH